VATLRWLGLLVAAILFCDGCAEEAECFPAGEVIIAGEGNFTPPNEDKTPCFGNDFTRLEDFRAMSDGVELTAIEAGGDAITYPDECNFTVSRAIEDLPAAGGIYSGRIYWLTTTPKGGGTWDGGGLLRLEDADGNQCENRIGNVRITLDPAL
jgi:hypothetical protein